MILGLDLWSGKPLRDMSLDELRTASTEIRAEIARTGSDKEGNGGALGVVFRACLRAIDNRTRERAEGMCM